MPNPFNKNMAIDNFIYNSHFNKQFCYIHPNEITILGLTISIILGYVFFYNLSFSLLLILIIIRTLCDIYDGMLARKCNRTSKIGKYLDLFSDFFLGEMILFLTFLKINNKYVYLKGIIIIILFLLPLLSIKTATSDYDVLENNVIFRFTHDNTIIFVPIITVLFYFLSNKFN